MYRTRQIKKLIQDYTDALEYLYDSKTCTLQQVEDGPFLRRKWHAVDKIIANVFGYTLPPTDYERARDNITHLFDYAREQLRKNLEAKIKNL